MSEEKNSSPLEISLEPIARVGIDEVWKALGQQDIVPDCVIVFGSAVNPREESQSLRQDPSRWDVDVMFIMPEIGNIGQHVLSTDSGKQYQSVVPTNGPVVEMQQVGQFTSGSPKSGLHLHFVESDHLSSNPIEDFHRNAIETGVLVRGELPARLQKSLEAKSIQSPRNETQWGVLRFSRPRDGSII